MVAWLPILIMLIVAVGFAFLSLGVSYLLSPKKATPEKLAPYECGIFPEVEPSQRFPVKFYMVAMLYIVFDIEINVMIDCIPHYTCVSCVRTVPIFSVSVCQKYAS